MEHYMEDHEEFFRDRRSFVVCASVLLLLSGLSLLPYAPRSWTALHAAGGYLSRWQRAKPLTERERFIESKIWKEKVALAVRLHWYFVILSNLLLMTFVFLTYYRTLPWLASPSQPWIFMASALLTLARLHVPSLFRPCTLDLHYLLFQLGGVALLLPQTLPLHGIPSTIFHHVGVFLIVSLPSATIASMKAVTLGQLAMVGAATARIQMQDVPLRAKVALLSLTLVFASFGLAVSSLTRLFLKRNVEAKIRENDRSAELSAASALLELTCDAVVHLDADLLLCSHCPQLATTLLMSPGISLEGRKFTDFLSRESAGRAEELFEHEDVARAFHTYLVDGCGSKFRTEVFQVKYTILDGRQCHLVGLRDITDMKSLAGRRAADEIREIHSTQGAVSDPDLNEVQLQDSPLSEKLSFMDIDMSSERVHCASAPLSSLTGRRIDDVFEAHPRQLLWKLCNVASAHAQEEECLPDQVATFGDMPLAVGPGVKISGAMKIAINSLGGLHVLMSFRAVPRTCL